MKSWFFDQITEIETRFELRIYGIALALIHLVTHFSWSGGDLPVRYFLVTTSNTAPICWPFLQSCASWKILSEFNMYIFGWIFAGLALLCVLAFALKKITPAWILLATITVIRLFLYAQDYRFTSEFQYMTTLVVLGYLLIPSKPRLLSYLILGFYLSASLFHFKQDWFVMEHVPEYIFRGGVLKWLKAHDLWVWGAAYSLLLTSVLSFGLLSKNRIVFWTVFAQIVLYHLVAQSFLGWHSTIIMLLLISVFPLLHFADRPKLELGNASWVYLFLFVFLQGFAFYNGSNKILTGQGRYGAVTMFDTNRKCQSAVVAVSEHQSVDLTKEDSAGTQWLECDPYTVFQRLKNLCPALQQEVGFKNLEWQMSSQVNAEAIPKLIVSLKNVCDLKSHYNWYGKNAWINE